MSTVDQIAGVIGSNHLDTPAYLLSLLLSSSVGVISNFILVICLVISIEIQKSESKLILPTAQYLKVMAIYFLVTFLDNVSLILHILNNNYWIDVFRITTRCLLASVSLVYSVFTAHSLWKYRKNKLIEL